MQGRTALVTGANTGLGLETAAALAMKGSRVVLTARDPAKGKSAVEEIRRRHPDVDVAALIRSHTKSRPLGILGEKTVNVLELNLALDSTH